jgi:fumarate hydratase class I/fumarate hydratase subunit beta
MSDPIRIDLPVSRMRLAELTAGDEVRLFGPVYTSRDAGHELLLAELAAEGMLPHGLEGATLFYAGPTPPAAGRPVGAVGPTTAKRMDAATPTLLRAGVVATIGKGMRCEDVRDAFAETGSVYFAAVGGAAALLATHITAAEPVAWPHLGTEQLMRMTLDGFPAFVAIDTCGGDLYADAPAAWRAACAAADDATSVGLE